MAAVWTKAQLRLSGLAGYSAGLQLVLELLERYWDAAHPVLDPSDGDATMRLNALRELCDRQSVLLPLRSLPLLSVPPLGSFSFKDISAAQSGSPDASNSKLEAALGNCETSHLQQLTAALQQCLDDLRSIERRVTEKLASQTVRFDELTALLEQMHQLLAARLTARAASASEPEGPVTEADRGVDMSLDGLTLQSTPANTAGKSPGPLQIRSRGDVQRTLDLLCAYYERSEPSSPVPILLKRARRLCTMSFSEIVRDLTPAGTAELEVIRGPHEADNT
jgi:type VI secretion system protein ImpA